MKQEIKELLDNYEDTYYPKFQKVKHKKNKYKESE